MSQEKKPFFARFLEDQAGKEQLEVKTGTRAGAGAPITLKYPSDQDEIF